MFLTNCMRWANAWAPMAIDRQLQYIWNRPCIRNFWRPIVQNNFTQTQWMQHYMHVPQPHFTSMSPPTHRYNDRHPLGRKNTTHNYKFAKCVSMLSVLRIKSLSTRHRNDLTKHKTFSIKHFSTHNIKIRKTSQPGYWSWCGILPFSRVAPHVSLPLLAEERPLGPDEVVSLKWEIRHWIFFTTFNNLFKYYKDHGVLPRSA